MTAVDWVVVAFGVLAGFAVGSFVCVIIDRLPLALDEPNQYGEVWDTRSWSEVFGGTSRCASCGTPVRPTDNVPVLSWLLLRGRCRACRERIPGFHPLVELLVPLVGVAVAIGVGWEWRLLPALALVPVGVAVAVIDTRTLMVPTRLVWPATAVVVALSAVAAVASEEPGWLVGGLVGVAVLAGPLFAIWWIHPRGMGFGDVRLAVLLGWSVGFAAAAVGASLLVVVVAALLCMVASAVFGLLFSLFMAGSRRGLKVPFGPAMVAAALCCVALAEPLTRPYR